jgi:ribonuclease HII
MRDPLSAFERHVKLSTKGFNKLGSRSFLSLVKEGMQEILIGIDEVGRGPQFGPMVIAGCANITGWRLDAVKDSKEIKSESKRKALANEIRHNCVFFIAEIPVQAINEFGTLKSLKAAGNIVAREMIKKVREYFPQTKIHVIYDGRDFAPSNQDGCRIESIEKADAEIFEVSCASIVAKSHHDDLIEALAQNPVYARYEISRHKGYGTKRHKELVLEHGLSDQHRAVACRTWLSKDEDDGACEAPTSQGGTRPCPSQRLAPSQSAR